MKKRMIALRIMLTALSAGMTALIFYNSSLDAVESTVQSDAVLDFVNSILRALGIGAEVGEAVIRKSAHFIEYFVLGGLTGGAVYSYALSRRLLLGVTLPLCAAVAVCDELIQSGSAGRACSAADMLLDFSAALTAALLLSLIIRLSCKRKEGKRFE